MDPYLEQNDTWEDFHQSFITHARDVLSGQVGDNYLAKIEVRLILHELSAEERRYMGRADVAVTGPPPRDSSGAVASLVSAPMQMTLPAVDVERLASLEIHDRRNRRVVTVVELLTRKKGTGLDKTTRLIEPCPLFASHPPIGQRCVPIRRPSGSTSAPEAVPDSCFSGQEK
jgi:hypothetical protein